MRRRVAPLLLLFVLLPPVLDSVGAPAHAQRRNLANPTQIRPSGPPHAWLFGAWTGGLFPVLDSMAEQDCRTQPTVVFAQDAVAHATLLGTGMTSRVIETVRTSPAGAELRFTPDAGDAGFGCESPEILHVARQSDSAISFPHCAAFPYPLHRCPNQAGAPAAPVR